MFKESLNIIEFQYLVYPKILFIAECFYNALCFF